MRLIRSLSVLAALAVLPALGLAQDTPLDSLKPKKPTRLFREEKPFAITLTADFKRTFRDRDTTKEEWVPAALKWVAESDTGTIPVEITTRGHFRLKAGTCSFPGLKVRFPKDKRKDTLWEGQGTIKLGAHCKSGNARYGQIPLQEILTYRTYNLLTDSSFRVRQVRATYIDTGDANKTTEEHAFFLEDDDDLAARMGMKPFEGLGATFSDVSQDEAALMSVFMYMVGNTDWSLPYLHNIRVFQNFTSYIAVPYDFDWSGIVDAPYAVPDYRLNIKSVRDRVWRGPCFQMDMLQKTFALYQARKDAIYNLWRTFPNLDPKLSKWAIEYFDSFYKTIGDPRMADREMRRPCTN
jgi:hypothetical protein